MAQLPIFYHDGLLQQGAEVALHEDTAKHIVQVLRMQPGDRVILTDGNGHSTTAAITLVQKRKCTVAIGEVQSHEMPQPRLHLAVAFTKNTNRNEWILEKATELGVATIIPLSTERSEREKFRYDRWQNILVAAMIQSQQYYLPELKELTALDDLLADVKDVPQKLVAHCMDDMERRPISEAMQKVKETIFLVGPEGDFTQEEVNKLTSEGYTGVSMSNNRLRTETAAVAACAFFNMVNHG